MNTTVTLLHEPHVQVDRYSSLDAIVIEIGSGIDLRLIIDEEAAVALRDLLIATLGSLAGGAP